MRTRAQSTLVQAQVKLAMARQMGVDCAGITCCEQIVKDALDQLWGEQERERMLHPTKWDRIFDWARGHNVPVMTFPMAEQCAKDFVGYPWRTK